MAAELVISGFDLITALGGTAADHEARLLAGERALGETDLIDLSPFHSQVVATVSTELPAGNGRRSQLTEDVLERALSMAGISTLPEGSLLVVVGKTPWIAEAADDAVLREFVASEPTHLSGASSSGVDVAYLSHACASVGFGLEFAATWLEAGLGPMATVVGANTLNAYEYASMDAVRVLSPSGARPFDPERDGTTIGEGGGALVLERAEDAAARGRLPLARLAGVACRVGGNSRSGVDHAIAAECLEAALAAAGQPEIDYVHAHATGTPQGDETELEVLAAVAGRHGWDDEIPVSSNKGAVGHLLYASMFPGIAAALTALRTGAIPGTPGLEAPRRDGPLRVLGRPERRARAANVLVDAFGFGGNNSALVLSA